MDQNTWSKEDFEGRASKWDGCLMSAITKNRNSVSRPTWILIPSLWKDSDNRSVQHSISAKKQLHGIGGWKGGVQSVISACREQGCPPPKKRMAMHSRRLVTRSWDTETWELARSYQHEHSLLSELESLPPNPCLGLGWFHSHFRDSTHRYYLTLMTPHLPSCYLTVDMEWPD